MCNFRLWHVQSYDETQHQPFAGMPAQTWPQTPRRTSLPNYVNIVPALLSGVPDFFDRNKILSGYDLSHYQVPHCIRVFFYFVWFVFIHHNFQFYFKLCTYCNILDNNLS